MPNERKSPNLCIRHIALPQDHGSWVFIISPLLIGLFASRNWSIATLFLIVAVFAAFLIRQPLTIAVKAYSGRRSGQDLPAARFWISIYALIGLAATARLIWQGYAFVLLLAIPGAPVFAWHLNLVSRRAERRQMGIELVATGVLALAAPAAYWAGQGYPDPRGWWLFVLVWLQSAASIVYAYLRLEQRVLPAIPERGMQLRMGWRAILYTTFNLAAVTCLALARILPPHLPLPYALQWAETLWGVFNPAVGVKPTRIGVRQLIVSSSFTLLFILAWMAGESLT